jgi:hypothetical protein
VDEKIAMRLKLSAVLAGGPLTPTGCAILAAIAAAIFLVAMLSTCWGRDGLDGVSRVSWWFA